MIDHGRNMKPGASSTGSRTEVCAFCDDDENHLNDSTQGAETPEWRQAIPKDILYLVGF